MPIIFLLPPDCALNCGASAAVEAHCNKFRRVSRGFIAVVTASDSIEFSLRALCVAKLDFDPMKIHEYQAKAILAKYDVPVPRGEVAFSVDEAEAAAKSIGGSVVVKAQIHAGGRGKGGGVKVAKDADEAGGIAKKNLGMKRVTHQTRPQDTNYQ